MRASRSPKGATLRFVTLRYMEWLTDYSSLIIGDRGQPKLKDSKSLLSFARIKAEWE